MKSGTPLTLGQSLILRAATKMLAIAGLEPYCDVRSSNSAKDVLGSRIGKRMTIEEALKYQLNDETAPAAKCVWRLYCDLMVVDRRPAKFVSPGSGELTPDAVREINARLATHTQASDTLHVGLHTANPRIVAGVMGNVRAHNGAPPVSFGPPLTTEKSSDEPQP